MVGVLGTTITPYLFYWQSSLMVEEEKKAGKTSIAARRGTDAKSIKTDARRRQRRNDLFEPRRLLHHRDDGVDAVRTRPDEHRDRAASRGIALRPLAGQFAEVLFALGMVGTGILAVPVLATRRHTSPHRRSASAKGLTSRYTARHIFTPSSRPGILVGIAMNLLRVNAIKALFWSAVLNGVAAVPLIAAIVFLASNRSLMGKWTSSALARAWGWGTVVLMGAATAGMFYFMARHS